MVQTASIGQPAELRTLHFSLLHAPAGMEIELFAGGRRHRVKPHSEASREVVRRRHALGGEARLASLTHFCGDVALSQDRIQLFSVIAGDFLLLAGLHIPQPCRARCGHLPSNAALLGLAADAADSGHGLLHDLFGSDDTAAVIIFLHPEIMNFDIDSFPAVYHSIINSPLLGFLSGSIASQGTGWSTRVALTDVQGEQIYDPNGKPYVVTTFSDQTLDAARQPIKTILQGIKDLPELSGHNWQPIPGQSFIASSPGTPRLRDRRIAGATAPAWSAYNLSTTDGLQLQSLTTAEDNGFATLVASFQNYYSRHLSVFARYLDVNGSPVPLGQLTFPSDDGQPNPFRSFDSDEARAIDVLPPQTTFAGVALTFLPATRTVSIPVPATTRGIGSIEILCGGIGVGANTYGSVPLIGIVLTSVFEYVFPVLLAAVGIGVKATSLNQLLSPATANLLVDEGLKNLLRQLPITEWGPTQWKNLLIPIARYVITYVLPTYGKALLGEEAVVVTAEASDPVGWALMAASLTATALDLAGTTAEVLQSPVVYANSCAYTMEIGVTLLPDARDPVFPQLATSYDVTAIFSNGITDRKFTSNAIPPNAKSLPVIVFDDIPSGGTVTIRVVFHSDTGWIAGQGLWQGANALQTGEGFLDVRLRIVENRVQLTTATQYSHRSRLDYAPDGSHAWIAVPAPTDTMSNLSIANTPQYITQLQSITYNVLTGSGGGAEGLIGYSWQATSPSIANCESKAVDASVFLAQVISSAAPPDSALSFSGCGLAGPVDLLFDFTDPSGSGFYYIDPRSEAGGPQYVVRRFDPALPPFQQAGTSCGRLLDVMSLDAAAIHQSKFLVGINTSLSKMEVVQLADRGLSDDEAPVARLLCGQGTRPGLLSQPVAVAVAKDGTILVLENGNQRIQALDAFGHPVGRFQSTPLLPLHDPQDGQQYLDMCVESTGYIYVLSHLAPAAGDDVPANYLLDIYQADGRHLCRTAGVAAARIDVDYWRNVYALNYHLLISSKGLAEPSISVWVPSVL